jgi:hypothetical protein
MRPVIGAIKVAYPDMTERKTLALFMRTQGHMAIETANVT